MEALEAVCVLKQPVVGIQHRRFPKSIVLFRLLATRALRWNWKQPPVHVREPPAKLDFVLVFDLCKVSAPRSRASGQRVLSGGAMVELWRRSPVVYSMWRIFLGCRRPWLCRGSAAHAILLGSLLAPSISALFMLVSGVRLVFALFLF